MLRLRETRPISTEVCRRATTGGRPGEGSGSVLCWSAYQSGSIQISATQVSASAGEGLASAGAGAPVSAPAGSPGSTGRSSDDDGSTGRGSEPVVKS